MLMTTQAIKVFSLLLLFAMFLPSCKDDEPFLDERLLDEFTVKRYEDEAGNVLSEKPDDVEGDIVLVIRRENQITGHLSNAGGIIPIEDGEYSISEDGAFEIKQLVFPELPTNDWDDMFISTYLGIESYTYDNGFLRLYYDMGGKVIVLSN